MMVKHPDAKCWKTTTQIVAAPYRMHSVFYTKIDDQLVFDQSFANDLFIADTIARQMIEYEIMKWLEMVGHGCHYCKQINKSHFQFELVRRNEIIVYTMDYIKIQSNGCFKGWEMKSFKHAKKQ